MIAAVAPFWAFADILPWGADAVKWTGRADNPDAFQWIFKRRHFVGYRPVAALSFAMNQATTGFSPWGYHLFDYATYGACLVGLGVLFRRWFGGSLAGLAAVLLLVLCHPVIEEVVPFPSRRSYLLSTAFGLWGTCAFDVALVAQTHRTAWAWVAGALLALSAWSNEVGYVFHCLVPLRLVLEQPRSAFPLALPTVAATLAGVASRAWVLGSIAGGYQKRYFALVKNGTAAWIELPDWQPARIAGAAASYLFVPTSPVGLGPALPSDWADLAAAAGVTWVVIAVGVGLGSPEGRRRLVLLAWGVGSVGIVVLSQTWFWRQAWSPLPPLALLGGAVVAEALRTRRPRDVALALPVVALVAAWAPYGAIVGAHHAPHLLAERGTVLVHEIEALGLPRGAPVYIATDEGSHTAQIARIWLDRRAHELNRHRVLATAQHGRVGRGKVTVTDEDGVRRATLSKGMGWSDSATAWIRDGGLPIDRLWRRPRGGWFVVADQRGARAFELHRPSDDALLGDPPPAPEPDLADDP